MSLLESLQEWLHTVMAALITESNPSGKKLRRQKWKAGVLELPKIHCQSLRQRPSHDITFGALCHQFEMVFKAGVWHALCGMLRVQVNKKSIHSSKQRMITWHGLMSLTPTFHSTLVRKWNPRKSWKGCKFLLLRLGQARYFTLFLFTLRQRMLSRGRQQKESKWK